MFDQLLSLFELMPDYDLNIMQNRQSFELDNCSDPARSGRDYTSIEPDWMLVRGENAAAIRPLSRIVPRHKDRRIANREKPLHEHTR